MKKIAEFTINTVSHPLCLECSKYDNCTSTCIAIEVLVQLASVKAYADDALIQNISSHLDLKNSFREW